MAQPPAIKTEGDDGSHRRQVCHRCRCRGRPLDAGIDFDGRLLLTAERISDDGTVLAGVGKNQDGVEDSWVLVLPELADESAPACDGDADASGGVDLADLNLVLSGFGTTDSAGDINGDGVVDLSDLNTVLGAFGSTCP